NKFDWTKATDGKAYPENVKSRDYMKGLIALRQSTDAFRLKSLQDIKNRVHLITVPGQNGVEKEDVVIGYQITAPNGDIYAVFVNADEKAREFNLGTAFAHLRNAEVLADENQAGPVGIANPKGLEWTEKGLKLNALTATVLRIAQGGAIVAPAVEEKSEFDLSSLNVEQEQGQAQNLAANPETQETAAEALSQKVLPNTGTESKSLLTLAGISLLALLGLRFLLKNKKEN
ncbi:MAG: LPXTG cell wall anchor domain-containing protein, partial [Streptococcus mitis]|nr:LPXTG cell wall anchor domain-containing protein [Streptococcus mitis]